MGPPAPSSSADRRSYWVAAIVLFGVIGALVVLTIVFAPSSAPPRDATGNQVEPRTRAIPRPNEGHAPRNAGDRGGWEQLATLAAIVGAVGLLVALAWRSSRRARKRPRVESPTVTGRAP